MKAIEEDSGHQHLYSYMRTRTYTKHTQAHENIFKNVILGWYNHQEQAGTALTKNTSSFSRICIMWLITPVSPTTKDSTYLSIFVTCRHQHSSVHTQT